LPKNRQGRLEPKAVTGTRWAESPKVEVLVSSEDKDVDGRSSASDGLKQNVILGWYYAVNGTRITVV
jgi:hypothetical protein